MPSTSADVLAALHGELLGDGCLQIKKHYKNALFQLQTKYQGQAHFTFAALHDLGGVLRSFIRVPAGFSREPHRVYHWHSHAHAHLTDEYNSWYVRGRKIVPANFKLTAVSARHWYVGDGSMHRGNPRVVLCTDGFDDLSITRLQRQLLINGFYPRVRATAKGHPRIELGVGDVEKWLSWIGPCPVPELQHKWLTTFRAKRNRYVSAQEREAIKYLAAGGNPCAAIAAQLGRSYHTVYSILHERPTHATLGS